MSDSQVNSFFHLALHFKDLKVNPCCFCCSLVVNWCLKCTLMTCAVDIWKMKTVTTWIISKNPCEVLHCIPDALLSLLGLNTIHLLGACLIRVCHKWRGFWLIRWGVIHIDEVTPWNIRRSYLRKEFGVRVVFEGRFRFTKLKRRGPLAWEFCNTQ